MAKRKIPNFPRTITLTFPNLDSGSFHVVMTTNAGTRDSVALPYEEAMEKLCDWADEGREQFREAVRTKAENQLDDAMAARERAAKV